MTLLYTKLKVFHFPEKLDSLPASVPAILPPLNVRLKPTNVCNHRCAYCAYRNDALQLGQDMDVRDFIPQDKMMEIVDDLIAMGVKAVTFSGGGEPFVYPYLLETVKRLAASDIKFASLTNGSRLTGEVAEIFAHRATWLRVSIDGWDNASYAAYRRIAEGEFSRLMQNMEAFQRFGGPCYLSVIMNVDATNAAHVYDLIRTLSATGVRSVKVAPVIQSNDGGVNNDYHRPYFESVAEQVARARAEFPGIEISSGYQAQLAGFAKTYAWCPYLQIRPVIGADLNVYACQDKAYNLADGLLFSIKHQSFRQGWSADKAQFFRVNPSQVCNHHCVSNDGNTFIHEYLDADPQHVAFV